MESPRIAYIISTRFGRGGAERLLVKLVEEGERRGWQQRVVNPFTREVPSAFAHLPSAVYTRRPYRRVTDVIGTRRWVEAELAAFQPDIVHVMLFHATVLVASLRRRRDAGAPRIVTHLYGAWIARGRAGAVKVRLDRWAVGRFDAVVAISESVRHFLARQYDLPPPRVLTIPPGWDGEPLPSGNADLPPTVVCVAQFRTEKGHDLLLDAFARVHGQVPDARLVLVGDGDLRPALEADALARGISGHVDFAGSVSDVWPYLAAAHVFALSSQSEAFGIAIVEAMAAGLPVVAPDVGGIPELVRPGVNGELFPAGDAEQLASRLVELLRSPERRDRMAAAARTAAEPLRMRNTMPRYFDLYAELMRAKPVPDRA